MRTTRSTTRQPQPKKSNNTSTGSTNDEVIRSHTTTTNHNHNNYHNTHEDDNYTYKIRTGTSPNNTNNNSSNRSSSRYHQQQQPQHQQHQQLQQPHRSNPAPAIVSSSLLSSHSISLLSSSSSNMSLSRKTIHKLNDPSYIIALRRQSIQIAQQAFQQLSTSTITSNISNINGANDLMVLQQQQQQQSQLSAVDHYPSSTFLSTIVNNHDDNIDIHDNDHDHDDMNSIIDSVTTTISNNKEGTETTTIQTPTEIATMRGTKRALQESNDDIIPTFHNVHHHYHVVDDHVVDVDDDIDLDCTTIASISSPTTKVVHQQQRNRMKSITSSMNHPSFHRVRSILNSAAGSLTSGGGIGKSRTSSSSLVPSLSSPKPPKRIVRFQTPTTTTTTMQPTHDYIESIQQQHQQQQQYPNQSSTTSSTTMIGNSSIGGIGIWRRKKQRKATSNTTTSTTTDKEEEEVEAWMCGVCGMMFRTEYIADQHEQQHIINVVQNMEWIAKNSMIPQQQQNQPSSQQQMQYQEQSRQHQQEQEQLFVNTSSTAGTEQMVMATDEALLDVIVRAVPMILSERERSAEYELELLARDCVYYDECTKRAIARRMNPSNRYRSDREDILAKVQNKFVDAYQLMKESDGKKGITDQYNRTNKKGGKEGTTLGMMKHTDNTLYVNVMVKNSVDVVRRELERLAKQRWEITSQHDESLTRFERFRVYTQMNVVKLAGIALASDFTPRRIAVQLSNDLYRLLTPKLKRRGVTIETEIEYRVGPYFVLAVNIKTIDWWKLIKSTHKVSAQRQIRWEKERRRKAKDEVATASTDTTTTSKMASFVRNNIDYLKGSFSLSVFDVIERAIALLYYVHWTIYLPICWVAYYILLGPSVRKFILTTVADEIFFYVEQKGMEMEIKVCQTEKQAAFMLSALREIRIDGQELKKKIEQSESREKGLILGPLMGPAIAADKDPAPTIPDGFEVPDNLEFIGLELNLSVGFQRLRWALLSDRSTFVTEALYKTEARYENIEMGKWSNYSDQIGEPKLADGVSVKDFIGVEKEGQYLMPKSAFVSANMCYETHYILAYNDYCFCLKKRARNPDAPFGKTFLAWTQYLVINTGNNTCTLTCSVQPEFPHGSPMVSRQITSGMRAGTGELFVLIGATIEKYADEFP